MNIKLFLRTIRAPFLTATIIPVFIGAALAWQQGFEFNWLLLLLTLVGAICFHIGTNVFNDYFDFKSGNDQVGPKPSPFSGGSRVIQEKLLKPAQVRNIGMVAFLLGTLIGIYLITQTDIRLFYLGLAGMFIGYFYSATPLQLGSRGIGELICGIGFGPFIVVGTYFVQTLTMPLLVWLLALPIGLLITAVLLINEFTDYNADKKVKKVTWVVKYGFQNAAKIYVNILALTYIIVIFTVIYFKLPLISLLCLVTFPLARKTMLGILKDPQDIKTEINSSASTIQLHLLFGLLLSAGLILGVWI